MLVAWGPTGPDAAMAWGPTGPDASVSDALTARLTPAERERADVFGAERRRAFLIGRHLIAGLVRDLCPEATGWTLGSRACPRCGAPHAGVEVIGAPALAGVSYADTLVVAAVAPRNRVAALGVDVEAVAITPAREDDLRRLLRPSRTPVLRRWTRIEAVLKADGRGLLVDPAEVRLTRGAGGVPGRPARFRLRDVPGPGRYLISLAFVRTPSGAAWAARSRSARG